MIRKVLIANRGEIAVRIARTLREMGICSVAAFSDADREAPFVQYADEAYRLGASPASESYLNVANLLSVARQAGVDAVHPGYGFLAENAEFASAVRDENLIFIGPDSEAIRLMGDKVAARRAVTKLGVPTVPGTAEPVRSVDDAKSFARKTGYPIAVKAAGGGGGRGIRIVHSDSDMAEALERASREAQAYFSNSEVYLERYFESPRHVEVQVLSDGRSAFVHLGERDCSVQRKHQKLIEEAPSPAVSRELRRQLGDMALRAAEACNYSSAGTVEFLLTESRDFYFLEMNTRIQVEHPVTEMVTGVDLIREMVLVASGSELSVSKNVLDPEGHAIEVRVNAEDPAHDFRPSAAGIFSYREAGGLGVRTDSGVYQGFTIPEFYDSLLSKVIVWGPDRATALARMRRALGEYRIEGPSTTIPFAQSILRHPEFEAGTATTTFVGQNLENLLASSQDGNSARNSHDRHPVRAESRLFDVEVNRKYFRVEVSEIQTSPRAGSLNPNSRRKRNNYPARGNGTLLSPMHGTVLSIKKHPGDTVEPGDTLFVIEAMKMENEVAAEIGGTLKTVHVQTGQTVEQGESLAVIA